MPKIIKQFFSSILPDENQDFRHRKAVFLNRSRKFNSRLRAIRFSMHSTDAWTATAETLKLSMDQVKNEKLSR